MVDLTPARPSLARLGGGAKTEDVMTDSLCNIFPHGARSAVVTGPSPATPPETRRRARRGGGHRLQSRTCTRLDSV